MAPRFHQQTSANRAVSARQEHSERFRPFAHRRQRRRELFVEALWRLRSIRSPPLLASEDLRRRLRRDDELHQVSRVPSRSGQGWKRVASRLRGPVTLDVVDDRDLLSEPDIAQSSGEAIVPVHSAEEMGPARAGSYVGLAIPGLTGGDQHAPLRVREVGGSRQISSYRRINSRKSSERRPSRLTPETAPSRPPGWNRRRNPRRCWVFDPPPTHL